MTKVQFNPSTLKAMYNASTSKAMIALVPDPCTHCDADTAQVVFSDITNCLEDTCSWNQLEGISVKWSNIPNINDTHNLSILVGGGTCTWRSTTTVNMIESYWDDPLGENGCTGGADGQNIFNRLVVEVTTSAANWLEVYAKLTQSSGALERYLFFDDDVSGTWCNDTVGDDNLIEDCPFDGDISTVATGGSVSVTISE